MQEFEIQILNMHWIGKDKPDDGTDLCLHGQVLVRIKDEILSNADSGSWTISATGLYLLRTLTDDYQPDDFSSQLLPHCGFSIYANGNAPVDIIGCPIGVDWTIKHTSDGQVKHISEKGSVAQIAEKEYRSFVFRFADRVESYYESARLRQMPNDEIAREGYLAFWREWKTLRYTEN
jgi:hypothetical protein